MRRRSAAIVKGGGWRAGLVLPPIQPGAGVLSELFRAGGALFGLCLGCLLLFAAACGRFAGPARFVASSRRPCAPLWWLVGWLCVVAWLGFGAAAGGVLGALAHLVAGCVGPSVAPLASPARASSRLRPLPGGVGWLVEPLQLARWRARLIGTPPTGSPPKIVGGQTTPPRLAGCACLFWFGGAKRAFSCGVPLVLFACPLVSPSQSWTCPGRQPETRENAPRDANPEPVYNCALCPDCGL